MKKYLLILVCLLTACSFSALAAEDESPSSDSEPDAAALASASVASGLFGLGGDSLSWNLDEGGVLTIALRTSKYDGMMEFMRDVWPWDGYRDQIREIVVGDGVTRLGDSCFDGCPNLTTVRLSASVTNITMGSRGLVTFHDCPLLASVEVAQGNEEYLSVDGAVYSLGWDDEIGQRTEDALDLVFYPPAKPEFDIPNTVTYICKDALLGMSQPELVLPDHVTSANMLFLEGVDIQKITFGSGFSEVYPMMFAYCVPLTEISVSEDNPNYTSFDGALYNKDLTELIAHPQKRTSIVIPETVTKIRDVYWDNQAYEACKTIYFPGTKAQWDALGFTPEGTEIVFLPEGQPAIPEASLTARDGSAVLRAWLYGADTVTYAFYDENEKMLAADTLRDVDKLEVEAPQSAQRAKVFLLDEQCRPLCQNADCPLETSLSSALGSRSSNLHVLVVIGIPHFFKVGTKKE